MTKTTNERTNDGDGDDIEKKNGKQQLSVIVIGVSNAFYLRSLPVATHTHTHSRARSLIKCAKIHSHFNLTKYNGFNAVRNGTTFSPTWEGIS